MEAAPARRMAAVPDRPIPDSLFQRWYGLGGEYAASPQMGVITGEASGRLVAIDLDTAKSPKAAEWWHGLMVIENYGANIETWRAVSGSGGAHIFFRYPAGFAMPTATTAIGVDLRGQGGFQCCRRRSMSAAFVTPGARVAPRGNAISPLPPIGLSSRARS